MIVRLRKFCNRVSYGAALALAAATVSPALAFDIDVHWASDAEIGPVSWTGFIFNPDVGYDQLNFDGKGARNLKDPQGFRAGAEIGYDRQIGSVVVGAEFDVYKSWLKGSRDNFFPDQLKSDMDVFGSIRGRLGYTCGRFLAYGTAGMSFGRLGITDNTTQAFDVKTLTGLAVGGGVEYVYNKKITLRAEYLHLDFGDAEYSSLPLGARSINPNMDMFGVGLVSRF